MGGGPLMTLKRHASISASDAIDQTFGERLATLKNKIFGVRMLFADLRWTAPGIRKPCAGNGHTRAIGRNARRSDVREGCRNLSGRSCSFPENSIALAKSINLVKVATIAMSVAQKAAAAAHVALSMRP